LLAARFSVTVRGDIAKSTHSAQAGKVRLQRGDFPSREKALHSQIPLRFKLLNLAVLK
jgi:hypothetical protein